ncbi:hypothetical protein ElyMa_002775800 [Elysia marginata]|uniref:Uncharacterized protein n=1 Tax=Elysia marginata TaxID=1093978 RepID=A0AAV4HLF6_9GAST|nr:hypothetical protein ElyMa_002775800 [Elysia marginata]
MLPDITNQVPLLESGLVLFPATATEETAEYEKNVETAALTAKQAELVQRSDKPLSRDIIDKKQFYPLSHRRGPDLLQKAYEALGAKFEAFSEQDQHEANGGTPEFEPAVDLVIGTMPMPWSMLYEADSERIRGQTWIEERAAAQKPKSRGKRVRIRPPWAVRPASNRPSLSEVFKQKEQQEILTEAAAAARGYFSLSRQPVATGGVEPATLGKDDTSKSAQDLTEESRNRQSWERSRSDSFVASRPTSIVEDVQEKPAEDEQT